ncbi:MAG: hypothetical protein AAF492_23515, partial [Verrucomicrobiota bacterium]
MNWSDRMNSAIEYIENNLAGSVSVTEAAKEAFCSTFHFQRMFFAIGELHKLPTGLERVNTLLS